MADCMVSIFFEHDSPSILHTDNSTELSKKTLMVRINELWKGTLIVHGRPRHPQDQGSVERAKGDFKNMLHARFREVKKECSQWAFHSGIICTPFSVYFGSNRRTLLQVWSWPVRLRQAWRRRINLDEVPECRQVSEFVPFTSSAATPPISITPLYISHLSLQEQASEAEVDRRTGS